MTYFAHHWISDRIVRIVDAANTARHLVLGNERAMLIDTGDGIGSLRAYVVALTEVPYDVILTHGHVDHASDATEFADKRVYLHPADRHLMSYHTDSSRRIEYMRTGRHQEPRGLGQPLRLHELLLLLQPCERLGVLDERTRRSYQPVSK